VLAFVEADPDAEPEEPDPADPAEDEDDEPEEPEPEEAEPLEEGELPVVPPEAVPEAVPDVEKAGAALEARAPEVEV
jgi:hypothetical protein